MKTEASMKCVKKALIRAEGVPIGQTAELHVNCSCGEQVRIVTTLNQCSGCSTVYDGRGWIQ